MSPLFEGKGREHAQQALRPASSEVAQTLHGGLEELGGQASGNTGECVLPVSGLGDRQGSFGQRLNHYERWRIVSTRERLAH